MSGISLNDADRDRIAAVSTTKEFASPPSDPYDHAVLIVTPPNDGGKRKRDTDDSPPLSPDSSGHQTTFSLYRNQSELSDASTEIALQKNVPLKLGRNRSLWITDRCVSREHVELVHNDQGLFAKQLSTNASTIETVDESHHAVKVLLRRGETRQLRHRDVLCLVHDQHRFEVRQQGVRKRARARVRLIDSADGSLDGDDAAASVQTSAVRDAEPQPVVSAVATSRTELPQSPSGVLVHTTSDIDDFELARRLQAEEDRLSRTMVPKVLPGDEALAQQLQKEENARLTAPKKQTDSDLSSDDEMYKDDDADDDDDEQDDEHDDDDGLDDEELRDEQADGMDFFSSYHNGGDDPYDGQAAAMSDTSTTCATTATTTTVAATTTAATKATSSSSSVAATQSTAAATTSIAATTSTATTSTPTAATNIASTTPPPTTTTASSSTASTSKRPVLDLTAMLQAAPPPTATAISDPSEALARKLFEEEKQHLHQRRLEIELENKLTELELEKERLRMEKEKAAHEAERAKDLNSGLAIPLHWQQQTDTHEKFFLLPEQAEYQEIEDLFFTKMGGASRRSAYTIESIERNQNTILWEGYMLCKKKLVMLRGLKGINEKQLFHGSHANNIPVILKDGFDHRVANMGGAMGAGVYFSPNSSYSVSYCGASAGGEQIMLLCRVLVGKAGRGRPQMRKPDNGFDSATDGNFCVFDNNQCYPEYVITFTGAGGAFRSGAPARPGFMGGLAAALYPPGGF